MQPKLTRKKQSTARSAGSVGRRSHRSVLYLTKKYVEESIHLTREILLNKAELNRESSRKPSTHLKSYPDLSWTLHPISCTSFHSSPIRGPQYRAVSNRSEFIARSVLKRNFRLYKLEGFQRKQLYVHTFLALSSVLSRDSIREKTRRITALERSRYNTWEPAPSPQANLRWHMF